MDRQVVYPGQILPETALLQMAKDSMIGVSKLAEAILGITTLAAGLACTPTAPASMSVLVGAGQIYFLGSMDATAYSSLAADTTHQIVKQGVLLDAVTLNAPAPATAGQSINYLVQATFQENDASPVVLPYYNSANPSQAWNGPGGNGTAQNTRRLGQCTVTIKAGTAATTGSQTTPAPDAGYVGLWVVTVANGQTTITAGNIVAATNAPFIANTLTKLAPLASPAFTGTPTAPTPAQSDNSTKVATSAFVLANAGRITGIVSVTAAVTLTVAQLGALIISTGGPYTITLPGASAAQANTGYKYVNGGTGAITLAAAGTDTIGYGPITSASVLLNPGDTFELYSNGTNGWTASASTLLGTSPGAVAGSMKNLKASANGISANVAVTFDELSVENATNQYLTLRNGSLTINTAAAGANGIDTGSLAASTWYSVWVIWNGSTAAGLISTSATAPTMPTGYTHKVRVGWIRTDGTANKYPLSFIQLNRKAQYVVSTGSNVANMPIMASGTAGSTTTPTWVAIATGIYVPPTASRIIFSAGYYGASATGQMILAPNNSYGAYGSSTNPPPFSLAQSAGNWSGLINTDFMLETSNIYWASSMTQGLVCCFGWEDNL